jgi:uncharacterized membrane protein HdeD (DUF308 family)
MIQFFIDSFNSSQIKQGNGLIFSGIISVIFGFIVIFVPEILVAFIALLFMATGIALFGWGLKIKKLQNQFQQVQINIDE